MKNLKSILLTMLVMLGTLTFTYAQNKVAHVNSSEIVPLLPEAIDARGEAEKLNNTYEKEIQDLAAAIQAKYQQYAAEAENQTDETNAERQRELADQEQSAQAYQRQIQEDMQKKSIEWMKPINEKFMKAVDAVADKLGIDYVFDVGANRGLLIRFKGKDITPEVKAELGL